MHCAADNGHVEIVKLLVAEFGADVNLKDNHATPLHRACSSGNLDIIKFLIEHGADVSAKDGDGTYFSPLSTFAQIIALTFNVFVLNLHLGDPPLEWAVERGHVEVVRTFAKDLDVVAKNNKGRTLLHWAAYYGQKEMVIVLVKEFGADVNAVDNDGKSPFDLAMEHGKPEISELLKELGAK